MIITCGTCGKGFVSDKGAARKYCSRKCYYQSQVGHAPTNPKRRENRECIVCGKGFETGGRAGKRKLFCSRTCQAYARVHRRGKVLTLSIPDAAYLAGLVDGEGSVTSVKSGKLRHTWRLSIANTNFRLLHWCKQVTGCGSVTRFKHDNPKWKDAGCWQCYSWNAQAVLMQLVPYLQIVEKLKRARRLVSELNAIRELSKIPSGG